MNSILAFALIDMLADTANLPTDGWPVILFEAMEYIPPYTLVPRFILGLRALYARDLPGICGTEIDTAFGLAPASGRVAAASVIMFADAELNEGLEQGEEIQMEEREIRTAGSSGV